MYSRLDRDVSCVVEQVTNLADDLAMERNLHQKAIESLEQKTREVEQQAEMLQQMEEASAAAHQANLELSRRMEEMNRLAEEEKLRRAQEVDVPAPPEPLAVPPPAVVPGVGDTEELKKELEKLTKMNDMKAKQLEAVQERVRIRSTGRSRIGVLSVHKYDAVQCVAAIVVRQGAAEFPQPLPYAKSMLWLEGVSARRRYGLRIIRYMCKRYSADAL